MLPYHKNFAFQQYQQISVKTCFTSQFIYSSLEDIPNLKRMDISIQTKKRKHIHFFYLWLLTGQIPYSRKFYPSWKNTGSNPLLRAKAKIHPLKVSVRPKNKCVLLHEILAQIISKQLSSEKHVWNFEKNQVQVIIPASPVTPSTNFLQAKNSYFPTIPLRLYFTWNRVSAFQKLMILRTLKILSPEPKVKGLDFRE